MDTHDWSDLITFASVDWPDVPETPGVYAVFEGERLLYAGMAGRNGRGNLRKRLKNHRDGNMVNMLKQYLWFAIVQHLDSELATSPGEAARRCRDYMTEMLSFRCLSCADGAQARGIEDQLKRGAGDWGKPEFNGS